MYKEPSVVVLAVGGVAEVPYDTFTSWSVVPVPWSDAIIPATNEPATTAAAGNPVQLVSVPALGVPILGVVKVIPAKVNAADALFIATPVVPIYIVWSVTANVPLAGNVTPVASLTVNVVPKLPLIVSVDATLLATPVPPKSAPTGVAMLDFVNALFAIILLFN